MNNDVDSLDSSISMLRDTCERKSSNHKLFFLEIPKLLDELSRLPLYNDLEVLSKEEIDLVHYTSWNNALSIFGKIQNEDQVGDQAGSQHPPILRMYNYEQSNDPYEGTIKPPKWKKIEDELIDFAKKWEIDAGRIEESYSRIGAYGCSFSSGSSGIEDDLTYWRLYGNDGQGCSLKVSKSQINCEYPYMVRYRDNDFTKWSRRDNAEDKNIADRLNKILTACMDIMQEVDEERKIFLGPLVVNVMFRIIHSYYHLIKHKAYEGEKEWRIIKVMPTSAFGVVKFDTTSRNNIKRYVDGPLLSKILQSASAITIGPTVPSRGAARAYIEHLVREVHDIKYVAVKNSKQTYRQAP